MVISLFLQAGKVLESFKSAFVHALSLSMPPALCEYCPYKQMQQLCKSLEGTYTSQLARGSTACTDILLMYNNA